VQLDNGHFDSERPRDVIAEEFAGADDEVQGDDSRCVCGRR
jgi:hypothetical protein